MRLLAATDYALRVLMLLGAEAPGTVVSVTSLAERLGGLSRHHLHKIVQDLTAAGVTRTSRGGAGGVALAAAPEAIRLGALVRRLEAGQAVVACFRPDEAGCTLLPGCRLRGLLAGAEQAFYQHLEARTLADCLASAPYRGGIVRARWVRPSVRFGPWPVDGCVQMDYPPVS